MKSSPLQLRRYFVTEISLTANREFDAKKEVKLGDGDLDVSPSFLMTENDPRQWQITLRIKQQPGRPDANAPYYFTLEMVGFFRVADDFPAEKVEWLVNTNGTSVLYSAAREVLRAAMAQGPYVQILLPTASFYDLKSQNKEAAPAEDVTKPKT
jgi:preprotein translocase subunit SecB